MLIDVDTGKIIERVPYPKQFRLLETRMTPAELEAVLSEINQRIDDAGGEIATAGWLPGSDWRGTAFQAVYEKAARNDYSLAARLFGLAVWYAVMKRPERWASGRFQKNGQDIGSRTYFRVAGG